MNLQKMMLSTLLVLSANSAWARSWWEVDLPSLPPVTEWKIGGSLGALWDGNKGAITAASAGNAVLGPLGFVYGLIEGHSYDLQKKAAIKFKAKMDADLQLQAEIKAAGDRWPAQGSSMSEDYEETTRFLGEVNAPPQAEDEVNQAFLEGAYCLIRATDKRSADDCKFDFNEVMNDIQKKYR